MQSSGSGAERFVMRWTGVGPVVLAGVILAPHAARPASADDTRLPVSIERIRAALEKPPPRLRLPEPAGAVPTFRVEVRQPVLAPIEEKPFDPTFGLPSIGELLTGGIERLRSAAISYTRGRARSRAKKEVQDALEAFCAVHDCRTPDEK